MKTLRQQLVRAAGKAGRAGMIRVALMLEMERARLAFAAHLSTRMWGPRGTITVSEVGD